jgi:hypothetical protein
MFGSPDLHPAVLALLFLGACLGHLGLAVFSHNWWYGGHLGKRLGDAMHLAHGLLVLAFPAVLWFACRWDLPALFAAGSAPPWRLALAAYVGLCWLVGFGVVPALTLYRLLRRPPAALLQTKSEVIDVAAQLGRRPEGDGRQRWLTRLPGNQAFQCEFVERTLALPRLPAAWDGLTVLHLSDVHFNGTPDRDYFRFVMDRCAAWRPDIVAVTGDVADSVHHRRWIVPLLGRLRWNVAGLAILGNHDHWYDPPFIRRRLRRLGMHVLVNSWERAGIDLMLSGHVHGGQIRFPVVGSLLVPSRYGRRYDCGVFAEPPTLLHVSRGVSGEHPLRYGCRPEVTRLTLRGA